MLGRDARWRRTQTAFCNKLERWRGAFRRCDSHCCSRLREREREREAGAKADERNRLAGTTTSSDRDLAAVQDGRSPSAGRVV